MRLADQEFGTRPLEKAIWAGAIDSLGGDVLGWFTRTTMPYGNIASIGLAAGFHPVRIIYFQRGGESELELEATQQGSAESYGMESWLFHRVADETGTGVANLSE